MTHLKNEKINQIINELNSLLSGYSIHYQNLRSMHWNVKGPEFFMLHEKFEEEYNDAQESIDDIAERILSVGGKPISRFSVYLKESFISEFDKYEDARSAIQFLLEGIDKLLESENRILALASEAGNEGTVALMSDLISKQEKTKWMFMASINFSYESKNILIHN